MTRWNTVSIVKTLASQENEIIDGIWDFISKQLNSDITFIGVQDRRVTFLGSMLICGMHSTIVVLDIEYPFC